MEQLTNVLGTLGAYFAVLLVLAVAIESLLSALKLGGWLRETVSPEQAMKDIKDWLPEGSQGQAKVAAINNMVTQFKAKKSLVDDQVAAIDKLVKDTAAAVGNKDAVINVESQLVAALVTLRDKFEADEAKRIAKLRALAAGIGFILALFLQIDTFQLLSKLFSENVQATIAASNYLHYGGMFLTGFAASAGSSFWHDQLSKVRAIKESVQNVQEALAKNK
jgi:hypothetical protein